MITLLFVHRKINEQGSINANKKMFVIHSALAAAYLFTWVVLLILVLYTEHVVSCNDESINENDCFYKLTGIHDIISFINSTSDLLIYCFIVFVLYPRYTTQIPSDDFSELTNEQVTQGSRFLKMLGFKNLDDLQDTLENQSHQTAKATRQSKEVKLQTTYDRLLVLMKKTRVS